MSRIEDIKHHEAEADRLTAEADSHRWEAARLITEELNGGKQGKTLAGEIGKSETHVSLMAKTWRIYLGKSDRPPFNDAYQAAKRGKAKPDPKNDDGESLADRRKQWLEEQRQDPDTDKVLEDLAKAIKEMEARGMEEEDALSSVHYTLSGPEQIVKYASYTEEALDYYERLRDTEAMSEFDPNFLEVAKTTLLSAIERQQRLVARIETLQNGSTNQPTEHLDNVIQFRKQA